MQVDGLYTSYTTPANCRDGPRYERGFTDCCFCFLYVLLSLALVTAFLTNGQKSVSHFEVPFDSDHQPCIAPYTYLYIDSSDRTKTICVSACPKAAGKHVNCRPNNHIRVCPTSSGRLVLDQGNLVCHDQGLFLPSKPLSIQSVTNSVLQSNKQLLITMVGVAAIALFIVFTIFLLPQLITYLYVLIFEIALGLIAFGFIYRYIKGSLPYFDNLSGINFKGNNVMLILGILFLILFIVSLYRFCTRFKQLLFVVTVLRIARKCLWENAYMLLVSLALSLLSLAVMALSLSLLYKAFSWGKLNFVRHGAFDQYEWTPMTFLWSFLALLFVLWNHGLMISLSNFLFESFAIHWYFNERVFGYSYSRCNNFTNTLRLLFWHSGTIVYGSVLTYLPRHGTTLVNLEYEHPRMYNIFCCCHKYFSRYVSEYCYVQTVLQGFSFFLSNQHSFYLRRRTKQSMPQLYLVGQRFMSSAKLFLIVLAVAAAYWLLVKENPQYFYNLLNLLAPLFIVGMLAQQVATHFLNMTGLLGDTIVFMYCVDSQIQRYGYGQTDAYSCPAPLRSIIKQSKLWVV